MEPSSENRRRGRPKAFSERELSDAEGRGILSERHRQNLAYAQRARRRLAELRWEGLSVPQVIASELGRVEGQDAFCRAATWYQESGQAMAAKDAAAVLRQMRTGRRPQEQPGELFKRLLKTIDDFRVSRPDAPLPYVERQLEFALEHVQQLQRYSSVYR